MNKIYMIIGLSLILITNVYAEIMITEIMYRSQGDDTNMEWIELYNSGPGIVNISGWKIKDGTVERELELSQGYGMIGSGSFAVLAKNSSNFSSEYPIYSGDIFTSTFGLNNAGEAIYLINKDKEIMDFLNYTDISKDRGYTIELNGSEKDNSDMGNWIKGFYRGSPGSIIKYTQPEMPPEGHATVPEFSYFGSFLGLALVGMIFILGRNR